MNKNKSMKRALLMSGLALLLCVSMLIGSTFAWFTDSVTSSGNRIVAGELKVDLLMDKEGTDNYVSIKNGNGDIFAEDGNGALWEPGKTEIVYLAVQNIGSLDLKYNILLNVTDGGLIGALEYAVLDGAKKADVTATDWATLKANAHAQTGDIAAGIMLAAPNGALAADAYDYFALAVHMKEAAGNQYQGKNIAVDVVVQATQLASESDSFGSDYDKLATFENGTYQLPPVNGTAPKDGEGKFTWTNEDKTVKVSGVTPDEAEVSLKPASTPEEYLVTVGDDKTVLSYDIEVTGQTDGSVVNVELFVGKGLANVKLLHEGTPMVGSYNSETGYLSFSTTSFSVYTVACSTPGTLPSAVVEVKPPQTIPKNEWNSSWSMINDDQTLDAIYTFKTTESGEEAAAGKFANWHADFVITFDRELKFTKDTGIAGNYGGWGWIGFTSEIAKDFDDTLTAVPANEPIRLLQLANGMTINYKELCNDVKEFTCGAFNSSTENAGATMTVELRLYETYTEEESLEIFGDKSTNHEKGNYEVLERIIHTFN